MTYLVTSDLFVPARRGETVTADQLAGCDLDALIAAGHIEAAADPQETGGDEDPGSVADPSNTADSATDSKE